MPSNNDSNFKHIHEMFSQYPNNVLIGVQNVETNTIYLFPSIGQDRVWLLLSPAGTSWCKGWVSVDVNKHLTQGAQLPQSQIDEYNSKPVVPRAYSHYEDETTKKHYPAHAYVIYELLKANDHIDEYFGFSLTTKDGQLDSFIDESGFLNNRDDKGKLIRDEQGNIIRRRGALLPSQVKKEVLEAIEAVALSTRVNPVAESKKLPENNETKQEVTTHFVPYVLSKSDIENNAIYKESTGTLADRIDFVWSIYTRSDKNLQNKAQKFLCYAFDIKDSNPNVHQVLAYLMSKREKYKSTNPYYIPGKSPVLGFHTGRNVPEVTQEYAKSSNQALQMAFDRTEILDVPTKSKEEDKHDGLIFFSASERSKYRVHIHKGIFTKDGTVFGTEAMTAHGKAGYAAFTLNAEGELSVFNHMLGADKIKHSSMNSGKPVPASGELKIENGILKSITTQSGHYWPSLFNIYRLLDHLVRNGVDIQQTDIISFKKPQSELNIPFVEYYYTPTTKNPRYKMPAIEIYKMFNEGLQSKPIEHFVTRMQHSIEQEHKIDNQELADAFAQALNQFKSQLSNMTVTELKYKIKELKLLINLFDQQYKNLAQSAQEPPKGHASSPFGLYSQQLREFKKKMNEPEYSPCLEMMKNS
jgi:hypothetical protein